MAGRRGRGSIGGTIVGAVAIASTVVAACSSGPSDDEARAVRSSVVTWFHAVRLADLDAISAVMSSACPTDTAAMLVQAFRDAASAGLQTADVGNVEVLSVQGDVAHAKITLDLQGTFGSGASNAGAFDLVREDGHWVVNC